ncbi:PilZ domain-containing protein [Sphingomonas sp. PB2P19]|uniref:PilZ domain-containing protein n=1 Tax=Sphingomonas rhamnosi TaxID=3096156 RepID=UPI002FC9B7FC
MLEDPDQPLMANGTVPERRSGKRHAIVLLIGRVCRNSRESVCLVHDISKFGLMARFTVPPVVGEHLRTEVRGLPLAGGTIRWVKGLKAGFQFDEPQDVDSVFTVKRADGTIARPPRFPISAPVRLRFGDVPFSATLIDISAGGAKLSSDTPVEPGQAGQVMLPDTDTSIYGAVCWTRDDRFGFRFAAPLSLATLSRILDC